jgi:hypothetical protein
LLPSFVFSLGQHLEQQLPAVKATMPPRPVSINNCLGLAVTAAAVTAVLLLLVGLCGRE